MKKGLLLAILLVSFFGVAATVTVPEEKFTMIQETISLSADTGAAVDFSWRTGGAYLYAVEIVTSADDIVTFTINSDLGTVLYTTTTAAGTSGEIGQPSGYWPIHKNRLPNYSLSGLGSGTATIDVTFVKK